MRVWSAISVWVALLGLAWSPLRLAAQSNVAARYLMAAANQERTARGLPSLVWDEALASSAGAHARVMAANREISHGFAGEAELAERASAAGARFTLISENVAEAPDATEIHDAWMRSAGHRENLLDAQVSAVGIAVVVRDRQLYAVEDFARVIRVLSLEEQEEAVRGLMARSGLNLLKNTTDARPACSVEAGFQGARRPGFVMRYTTAALDRLPGELVQRLRSGRYREAAVGACADRGSGGFNAYRLAVLLYF